MYLPFTYVGVRGGRATHLIARGETTPLCGAQGEWRTDVPRRAVHSECRRRAGAFLPVNPRMTEEEIANE